MTDGPGPEIMEDVEKLTELLNLVRLNRGDVLWQSSVETDTYKVAVVGSARGGGRGDEAGKDPRSAPPSDASLNAVSGIYSLLVGTEVVPWYRIKDSANIFIWHKGTTAVLVHEISDDGELSTHKLGDPLKDPGAKFLLKFSGSSWFASELQDKAGYALYNCFAAPGFTWEKLDTPTTDALLALFPDMEETIRRFPRDEDQQQPECAD